jgi:hypothetical protein
VESKEEQQASAHDLQCGFNLWYLVCIGCGTLHSISNGVFRVATRAPTDCPFLSSCRPTSSNGTPDDPVSWLGLHMVRPCFFSHSIACHVVSKHDIWHGILAVRGYKARQSSAQLENLSFLLTTYLLLRLLWRAYQVLHTPNEILVDKLGLDIPPAPELILEKILPRQINISWKQPELPNSIHKHVVHINGKKGLLYAPRLSSPLVLI